ncbi:MAG: hypothetical protein ACOCN7_08485, partial [Prevotella sp.]
SIFAVFKRNTVTMREKQKFKMELSFEEKELIESIRNYCNSYPNGYPQLLEYAQDLFDRITDMPKDD